MFSGRYEYSIDDKGRLSIPAKYRDILASHYSPSLMLTNQLDGCIAAYPIKEWEALQERIEKSETAKTVEGKSFLRLINAAATECPIDKLGRILLPQFLRNYGAIKKNVMIVGMIRKIEIWAEDSWTELMKRTTSDMEKMNQLASEFGF